MLEYSKYLYNVRYNYLYMVDITEFSEGEYITVIMETSVDTDRHETGVITEISEGSLTFETSRTDGPLFRVYADSNKVDLLASKVSIEVEDFGKLVDVINS